MSHPALSIILPVYKVEKYLPDCLNSLLAQTFSDYELICVNDGSPDNSRKILASYAEKDSRIRIIDQENQGLSAARNAGIEVARGDYLYFIDSDDYAHPQLLEFLYRAVTENRADISCCGYVETNAAAPKNYPVHLYKQSKVKVYDHPLQVYLQKKIPVVVWCKLYKRSLFEKVRFVPGIYFEDLVFSPEIMDQASRLVMLKDKLYYYLQRGDSITGTKLTPRKINDYMILIRKINNYFAAENPEMLPNVRHRLLTKIVKQVLHSAYKTKTDEEMMQMIISGIRALMSDGIISYRGFKLRRKLALYMMLHYPYRQPLGSFIKALF